LNEKDDQKTRSPISRPNVIDHPEREVIQADGRVRRWAAIPGADGKYLRVILLQDRETVHNAFFDRRFSP
jgi:hypothetical protein